MADSRNKLSTEAVGHAVAACLSRHSKPGDTVTVGFSGGLDSTVLLHATNRLVGDASLGLSACHVHHGLSPCADAWAESCRKFCSSLGIPITVLRVEVPARSGEGMEAAARRMRHKALSDQPADWVLIAHHADDQAETILHNLLRGTGVRGAAAMPESRGRVLRPLLGLGRAILLEYASAHHLTWIEDESNVDLRYTRNFLRREIIPAIASRFPRASEQLAAAARHFSEADSLLDDLATMDLGVSRPEFPLQLALFRQLSDARARNLLRAMLGWHKAQPPDERRLREFVRQLRTAGTDRHPRLDLLRYSLWCEGGRLHFRVPD
ncbi:MAG: tRNA lysidine(34) synthetase TilS [Betaproteobacteria bacterium]|nr:tRNA lysidine(34) synthetase TilS [Betaproteobacteria bacterium]